MRSPESKGPTGLRGEGGFGSHRGAQVQEAQNGPPRGVPAPWSPKRPRLQALFADAAHQAQGGVGVLHPARSVVEHFVLLREGATVHRGQGALQGGPTAGPWAPWQLPVMLLFRAEVVGAGSRDGDLLG